MSLRSTLNTGRFLELIALFSVLLQGSVADFRPDARASAAVATVRVVREAAHAAPVAHSPAPAAPQRLRLLPIVNQPDILPHHQTLADRVLRHTPSLCRRALRNFYVRYGQSDRRGYGGKTTIVLDGNVPDTEFVSLLVHECGHVIHANLAGRADSGPSGFRDGAQIFHAGAPVLRFFRISWERENVLLPGAQPADFASGYARTDAFEDFAEFLVAYILHTDLLAERAQGNSVIAAKLAWMETELPLSGDPLALDRASWDNRVPWDMTKLPLQLPQETVALGTNVR